jgi:hypothetical protein
MKDPFVGVYGINTGSQEKNEITGCVHKLTTNFSFEMITIADTAGSAYRQPYFIPSHRTFL